MLYNITLLIVSALSPVVLIEVDRAYMYTGYWMFKLRIICAGIIQYLIYIVYTYELVMRAKASLWFPKT